MEYKDDDHNKKVGSTIVFDNINSCMEDVIRDNNLQNSLTKSISDENEIKNQIYVNNHNKILDGLRESTQLNDVDQTNTEVNNKNINQDDQNLNNNIIQYFEGCSDDSSIFSSPKNSFINRNNNMNHDYIYYNPSEHNSNNNFNTINTNSKNNNYNTIQLPSSYNSFGCSLNNIVFAFNKEKMRYDFDTIIKACPVLIDYLEQIKNPRNNVLINMPDWINPSELLEYFFYFKNSSTHNFSIQARKILHIADFFENQELINSLIIKELIPYLNTENALYLLEDSFQKLTNYTNNKIDKIWYDLFISAMDCVSKNFLFYAQNEYNKMKHLNKKLLEEIIEKFLSNFIFEFENDNLYSACGITTDKFQILIDFIILLRNYSGNIFDLLSNEYLIISSEESSSELAHSQLPTFQIILDKDLKYFYQEFNVPFNKFLSITFVVYYKKSEDTFNVSYKISNSELYNANNNQKVNNNQVPILTLLSVGHFLEEKDIKQTTIKSVASTKTLLNIFRINQFKQNYVKRVNSKNLSLNIYLKICYIHSTVSNFILRNYEKYHDEPNIYKISRQLLGLIFIKAKTMKLHNYDTSEDLFVVSLIKWLNDEINLHEDNFRDLLELIDWNKVSLEIFCEFVMKFYKIIEQSELENYFSEMFEHKTKIRFFKQTSMRSDTFNNNIDSKDEIQKNSNTSTYNFNFQNLNIINLNPVMSKSNLKLDKNSASNLVNETVFKYFTQIFMNSSKKIDYTKLLTENLKFLKFSNLPNKENSPLAMSNYIIDKDLGVTSIENSRILNFLSEDDDFDKVKQIKKCKDEVQKNEKKVVEYTANAHINTTTNTNNFNHYNQGKNKNQPETELSNNKTIEKIFNYPLTSIEERDMQNEIMKTINSVKTECEWPKSSKMEKSIIKVVSSKSNSNNNIVEINPLKSKNGDDISNLQPENFNSLKDDAGNNDNNEIDKHVIPPKNIYENYNTFATKNHKKKFQSGNLYNTPFKNYQAAKNGIHNNFHMNKNTTKNLKMNTIDSRSYSENFSSRLFSKKNSEERNIKSDSTRKTDHHPKNQSQTLNSKNSLLMEKNLVKKKIDDPNKKKKFDFYEYSTSRKNNQKNMNSLNSMSISTTNLNKNAIQTIKNAKYSIDDTSYKEYLLQSSNKNKQSVTNSMFNSTKSRISEKSITQNKSKNIVPNEKEIFKDIDINKLTNESSNAYVKNTHLIKNADPGNLNNNLKSKQNFSSFSQYNINTTSNINKNKNLKNTQITPSFQKSVDLNLEKLVKNANNIKKESSKLININSYPSTIISNTGKGK